jgi:hypothetical protein
MSKNTFVFRTFALLTLFCAGTVFAQAQAPTRVWVASSGVDAAGCGVRGAAHSTTPCRTIRQALAEVASGGEINAVDAADYTDPAGAGTIVINKPVTIDGLGVGAVLSGRNFNDLITVAAGPQDTVIIRNMSLTGFQEATGPTPPGQNGVVYRTGGALVLHNLDIHSFRGASVFAQASQTAGPGATQQAKLAISDVKVYNNYAYGMYLDGDQGNPLDVTIDNARVEANGVNFGNGTGLAVIAQNGSVQVVVRDSIFAENTTGVIVAANTGRVANVHIEDSSLSVNNTGLQTGNLPGTARVYLSDSVVQFNNSIGITVGFGSTVFSFQDNKITPPPPGLVPVSKS